MTFMTVDGLQHAVMHLQIAGSGRGLVAKKDIHYGTQIHTEAPMLCYPSAAFIDKVKLCPELCRTAGLIWRPAGHHHACVQVCYHCMQMLPHNSTTKLHSSAQQFCSSSCLQAAQSSYLAVEQGCHFANLHKYCEAVGERFPLLLMRLACMHLQQQHQQEATALTLYNAPYNALYNAVKVSLASVHPEHSLGTGGLSDALSAGQPC